MPSMLAFGATGTSVLCAGLRRGVGRKSISRIRGSPKTSAKLRSRKWRSVFNCRCQIQSSTSTMSVSRTSIVGRVCSAIFFPAATFHAARARASWSAVLGGNFSFPMSRPARCMIFVMRGRLDFSMLGMLYRTSESTYFSFRVAAASRVAGDRRVRI